MATDTTTAKVALPSLQPCSPHHRPRKHPPRRLFFPPEVGTECGWEPSFWEAQAGSLGRPVAASVVYRFLARHDWRKVAPNTRHPRAHPQVQQDYIKLPQVLADLLKPEAVRGRPVRVMFQDEARFGRMVRLRRCWAPAPLRPIVPNGYERQLVYVYGAASPQEGELDWKRCAEMNTERMNEFLAQKR